jgi:Ni2+-binding GTPase involved in maturation of urease and hydrogenase
LLKARSNIEQVCPGIPVLATSARTGEGMDEWLQIFLKPLHRRSKGV